jgi:maltose alpha-D-glucosyltransferase / alpha-amylase
VGEDGISALMPHALARLRRRSRTGLLYDAIADEGFCREVVAAVGEGRALEMGEGRVVFSRTGAYGEVVGEDPVGSMGVRRAEAEKNNSLAVLGERLVLKAYRHLQNGPNPDLEVGRYLTERVSFGGTPPLAGTVEYEFPDEESITLALLQGFVENQGDGWSYTRDILTRYLENRLATSWNPEDEQRTETEEQAAEDAFFAGVMRTLGLRTGELHAAFAASTDDEHFAPEVAPPGEVANWAEKVGEELGRTLEELEKRREDLPERVRRDADHLIALRDEAQRCARAVARGGYGVVKTRYHGDYRLEQVLVVGNDFQIIDFEGDPARPLAERRTKHSPLRDVAGMLLSLDRAARFVLANLGAERAEHLDTLEPLSRTWGERARRCFLEGYAERARRRLLPRERGTRGCPCRTVHAGEGPARDPSPARRPPGASWRPHKGSHRATRAEEGMRVPLLGLQQRKGRITVPRPFSSAALKRNQTSGWSLGLSGRPAPEGPSCAFSYQLFVFIADDR